MKFFFLILLSFPLFAEGSLEMSATLEIKEHSDDYNSTLETYDLKNGKLNYAWKYGGYHPAKNFVREKKRSGKITDVSGLQFYLKNKNLLRDINIHLRSSRKPYDNRSVSLTLKINSDQKEFTHIVTGQSPLPGDKNREFENILEFLDLIQKSLE